MSCPRRNATANPWWAVGTSRQSVSCGAIFSSTPNRGSHSGWICPPRMYATYRMLVNRRRASSDGLSFSRFRRPLRIFRPVVGGGAGWSGCGGGGMLSVVPWPDGPGIGSGESRSGSSGEDGPAGVEPGDEMAVQIQIQIQIQVHVDVGVGVGVEGVGGGAGGLGVGG